MNIHEYQAKHLLEEFGAPVPKGVMINDVEQIKEKIKNLTSKNLVIKAQIHAGGRGKAGGIKLVNTKEDLIKQSSIMLKKTLVTHQTGKKGKKVKKIYIEEVTKIKKELYISCLVDRASSKIAYNRS